MTTTIAQIRAGLAGALAAVQDGSGSPEIYAYAKDGPTTPCVRVLRPEEITYDIAMQGGGDSYIFIVQALVGLIDDQSAQENLDAMLSRDGVQSIKTAIEQKDGSGDASLGGAVDQAWVKSCTGYQVYSVGGADVLGAQFLVQIETTG